MRHLPRGIPTEKESGRRIGKRPLFGSRKPSRAAILTLDNLTGKF